MEWALKSLKRYKAKIYFEDINEAWLNGYDSWMIGKGNSGTTVQIYLRNLRTICNLAIKQGYISEKHYPFKNYTIGTSIKSKSVIYADDLKKLWVYEGKTLRERRAKDYFFMCYLCNGCNFKDVAYLKQKDIGIDTLSFVREKTKRTNRVADKRIVVYLLPEIKEIIQRWGNKSGNPDAYVFPILNGRKTAADKEERRKRIQRQVNDKLGIIAKRIGIKDAIGFEPGKAFVRDTFEDVWNTNIVHHRCFGPCEQQDNGALPEEHPDRQGQRDFRNLVAVLIYYTAIIAFIHTIALVLNTLKGFNFITLTYYLNIQFNYETASMVY